MSDIRYQDFKASLPKRNPHFDAVSQAPNLASNLNFNHFDNKNDAKNGSKNNNFVINYDELGTLKNRTHSNTTQPDMGNNFSKMQSKQEVPSYMGNIPMGQVNMLHENPVGFHKSEETNMYQDIFPKVMLGTIGGASVGYLLGYKTLTLMSLAFGGGLSYLMNEHNNASQSGNPKVMDFDFQKRVSRLS
jgi:hypothetical protein